MIIGRTTCPDGSVSAFAQAETYVFSLPDLMVRKITISPSDTVNEGIWVWILVEVENIGSKEARNALVVFSLSDTQIGSTKTIIYIGPGQTRYAGITWKTSPSGTHTMKCHR
ncbi:MAG: CARDB domain-containing protein [bacterium]